jgi:hypothetical protein
MGNGFTPAGVLADFLIETRYESVVEEFLRDELIMWWSNPDSANEACGCCS